MTSPTDDPPDGTLSSREMAGSLPSVVLLSRIRAGSVEAREELLRRYWPRLERWAHGRLPAGARDLYDTADLVQETMMKALGRLSEFEPRFEGALPAYFRAAILNRIRTLAGRTARRGETADLGSALVDSGPSPLEEAVGREAVERYEKALSRLRPEDRDLIQLRVELRLSYAEVAAELSKPTVSSARMAVSRALYRLATEMGRHA